MAVPGMVRVGRVATLHAASASARGFLFTCHSRSDLVQVWAAVGASALAGGVFYGTGDYRRGDGIGHRHVSLRHLVGCGEVGESDEKRYLGIVGAGACVAAVGALGYWSQLGGSKSAAASATFEKDPQGLRLSDDEVRHVSSEMKACLLAMEPRARRRGAMPEREEKAEDATYAYRQKLVTLSKSASQFTEILSRCEGSLEEGLTISSMTQDDAVLRRFRAIFEAVDLAGSGSISVAEFSALSVLSTLVPAYKAAPVPNFNQLAVQLFAELDCKGKERIGEDEFRGLMRIMRAFGCFQKNAENPPTNCIDLHGWYERNAARGFRDMDTSGAGYVGLSDFACWCRRHLNRAQIFRHYGD